MPTSTRSIDQVRADTTRFSVDYAALMADLDKKLEQNDRRQDRAYEAWEIGTITLEKYRERVNALKKDRERLEQEKAEAEAIMGEDAMILTDPKSVRDHATQLREFLETVEPSEWKPIIRTFVRNVSIGYTEGVITYKIPLPDDDPFARRMTSTIDLPQKQFSLLYRLPRRRGDEPSRRSFPRQFIGPPPMGEDTLLVYEDDTGSTATTFTDTDVTAGVRHVYRVKAVNAAGLSQRSNYARAEP